MVRHPVDLHAGRCYCPRSHRTTNWRYARLDGIAGRDADKNRTDHEAKNLLLCKPSLTRMHNIVPVEVKSGRDYEAVSLGKFRRKFADQVHVPVVLHVKNLKTSDGIVYLPLYMAPLLLSRPL